MLCASIKKKGSTEQCNCHALPGYMLCGRHAKSKKVVFWKDIYKSQNHSIIRFQAIIRGWLVRKRLSFAGPGVLHRKNLANDEDLETCTESYREHPFTYFAFEENGKIWWFHYVTLWKWCLEKVEPTNPYTKTPLTQDTLFRLRKIWAYTFRRNRQSLPPESRVFTERLRGRWNILCQIFNANGFGIVHFDHCINYTRYDFIAMYRMMRDDLNLLFCEQDRKFCSRVINDVIKVSTFSHPQFILNSVYGMIIMLMCSKEQYALAFNILSAMYRC